MTHVETPGGAAGLEKTFEDYRATLAENRRELVERYRFVDFALKVVGVGSVGTRCFVVLLEGRDESDPLHPPGQGGDRVRARGRTCITARTRTTASVSSSASG